MSVDKAVATLAGGGVIAYPTEGVFGLGCLPDDHSAVQRILKIKQRDVSKGLILIAASPDLLHRWISLPDDKTLPEPDPQRPVTWIVPAGSSVSDWVRGANSGLAVRISTHPVARAISANVRSPVVSTSANLSGQAVARNHDELSLQFGSLVDYIVPGECGPASAPSEIRELITGKVLRPGS